MRTLPAVLIPSLKAESVKFVHLVELDYWTGAVQATLRLTDAPANVIADVGSGDVTFVGAGEFLGWGGASETADRGGQSTRLVLTGVSQTITAVLLNNDFRNRGIRIWRAYAAKAQNLVPDSVAIDEAGSWIDGNASITPTGGQADPWRGLDGWKLDVPSAVANSSYRDSLTFTVDGNKGVAWFLRDGTAAVTRLTILDSGTAERIGIDYTWTNGVPIGAITTGGGTLLPLMEMRAGWWRVAFIANGVLAAGTNQLRIYPVGTGATTGFVYCAGPHVIDRDVDPFQYQPTVVTPIEDGSVVAVVSMFTGKQSGEYRWKEERDAGGVGLGSVRITTRIASRLSDLQIRRPVVTSVISHNNMLKRAGLSTGDTFFQNVPADGHRPVEWGDREQVEDARDEYDNLDREER